MLRSAAAKHTEHIVVEAAVDTEAEVKPVLPDELIDLLRQTIQVVEEKDDFNSPVRVHSVMFKSIQLQLIHPEFVRKPSRLDVDLRLVYKCGKHVRRFEW